LYLKIYYGLCLSGFLILASFLPCSSLIYQAVIISFTNGRYDAGLISAAGGKVTGQFEHVGMLKALVPQSSLDYIRQIPGVDFIEGTGQTKAAKTEDVVQTDVEYSGSWALADIGAEPIHSLNYTGKGVKIAILDTGVDYHHPDLAPNYKGGHDFINNDDDPMDDNGHGTHVAGIIAAARNGKGIVGVAPNAELYAVKVSDSKGKGSFSTLVEGINWAIDNHMNIITMSITGEGGSPALAKAVNVAYHDFGIILVAAVGNGNGEITFYPAAYDEVIGVGSIDKDNNLSSFSLTGSDVEFVAPGTEIKSTWPEGKYAVLSGTSMATPFVTGAIALLLGSNEKAWNSSGAVNGDGKWTNDEIRQVLRYTAKDLGPKGHDDLFGYGLISLQFPGKPEPPIKPTAYNNEEEQLAGTILSESVWTGLKFSFYVRG
jgi:subtilisin family serine protease